MQKTIALLLLVLCSYSIHGQNDYAILVKTYIKDESGAENWTNLYTELDPLGSINNLNGGSAGGGGDYTNVTDFETTFHDFYVPYSDFDYFHIDFLNSDDEGCFDVKRFTYSKVGFSTTSYQYPDINDTCASTSTIYTIHQDQPSGNESVICKTDAFVLKYGYNWQFRLVKDGGLGEWEYFDDQYQEKRTLSLSLEDFLDANQLLDLISIDFRTGFKAIPGIDNTGNTLFTTHITYEVVECSPDYESNSVKNASCFGDLDGNITLTFSDNITEGYRMRYFVYDASATLPTDPQDPDPDTNPNADQTVTSNSNVPLEALTDGSGFYSGSLDQPIGEGDYRIIYQEYGDVNGVATVKSGKVVPGTITIGEPELISVSILPANITQPICSGETGSVTVTGIGGGVNPNPNADLYYGKKLGANETAWNTVINDNTFDNLSPGSYTFHASTSANPAAADACKSAASAPIIIETPQSFDFIEATTRVSTQPSQGASDGAIEVTLDGGRLNIIVEAYNVNTQGIVASSKTITVGNSTTLDGLAAGTYTLRAIDNSNGTGACTIISTPEYTLIEAPNPTFATPTKVHQFCNGTSDGSVSIDFTNTQMYNYSYRLIESNSNIIVPITAGSLDETTITIDNLLPDSYTLQVIFDSVDFSLDNTRTDVPFIINEAAELTISLGSIVTPNCNGITDGYIEILPSEAGTFEYSSLSIPWQELPSNNQIAISQAGFQNGLKIRKTKNVNGNVTYCESNTLPQFLVPFNISLNTPVITNIAIRDQNTGAITITAVDGIPITTPTPEHYSYTLEGTLDNSDPFTAVTNTTGVFTNLYAGDYIVTATDANGCTATSGSIIVLQPGALILQDPQFIMTPVDCFGNSNGRITARYTGTAPFLFEWFDKNGFSLKSGTEDFMANLPVDIGYYYTIRDVSNVTITSNSIEVTGPTAVLEANTSQTEVTCYGDTNGTITVTAQGGTAPYIYQISGNLPQAPTPSSFTFNNLSANNYTINVTDANGCSITPITATLNPATPITFDDTNAITPVSAPGGSDGAITVTVQGGATPYYYQWTGPSGTVIPTNITNTTTIQNLVEGTYSLEVSNKPTFDIDGCYLTKNYTVTEQTAFTIQNFDGTPTCNGQTNGSLTSTIQATGNVTFNWTLQNGTIVATETTNLRTVTTENLAAGNYYLEIVDATNRRLESSLYEIIELPEVSAAITLTPSCPNGDTGSITFSNPIGSLVNSYEYSIDDGVTFQTNPIFENLAEQLYTIRVRATDNSNCDYILPNASISTNPDIVWNDVTTIITRASGPGQSDGAISPIFSGGNPPFEYQWSANANNATTQNVTGLAADTYTVTVTDNSGCFINQNIEVTEVGPLTILNIIPTDASCKGEATGSITTTVTGEGDITYEWTLANGGPVPVSNGINAQNITGVFAGSYILTATDDNTTVSTVAITIGEPTNALNISAINPTNVSCFGSSDGTLNVIAEGGTAPYTYSIDGTNFQNSPNIINLGVNAYTVTVRDTQGCLTSSLTPTLITEPLELGLIINEQRPITAANTSDGAISITPTGGSGNFTYSWTGPNGYTSTDEDIFTLFAGNYILTITDDNYTQSNGAGCVFTSNTITITEPGVLLATISQTVSLECNGDTIGEIVANVQGGVEPYTYEWYQINNTSTLLPEESSILGDLSAGTYFTRVTDANLISVDTQTVIISEPNILQITEDTITNVLCAGEETGAIAISVSGGTFPYSYVWDNGATIQDISSLEAGEYVVEVIDAIGCFVEKTFVVTAPNNVVQISSSTITNSSAYEAEDGSISIEIDGGLSPYNINWLRLSDNNLIGTSETISNLRADTYEVTITDDNGCTIKEEFEITQPDIVEETIIEPSCNGLANGSVNVLVNKGNGAFTFDWNTGATTSYIDNLVAGIYTVTINGFGNGSITRTYTLEEPVALEVNLGTDRVLCLDQELTLDATVENNTASYSWISDNGFTSNSPSISPTKTGNYTVTITTNAGCTTEGSIFVDITTDEINAEFAVSSQVFVNETIIGVDISFPLPESIEWILPLGANIITQNSDEVEFSFDQAGTYDISIVTKRGDCIAQKTKTIIVAQNDVATLIDPSAIGLKVIEDFIVFPNPTNGEFTAEVNLTERGNISIKIFSFTNNQLIAHERARGEIAYNIPFNISGMPSGVYAVLLETPYGNSLRKIVIK